MSNIVGSTETWNAVTRTLFENFNFTETSLAWVSDLREELAKFASGGMSTAPDFTIHNEAHSDNIILILAQLIRHLKKPLSNYEARLLVASAYLHDIGMFFGEARFREEIRPQLPEVLKVCTNDACDSPDNYADELEGLPIPDQIRMIHHLLTGYLLSREGLTVFPISRREVAHLIVICRGHRKALLTASKCACYQSTPSKFGIVRRGLLTGLLRLADALDLYPERTPSVIFKLRIHDFLENPLALRHWLQHYFLEAIHITIDNSLNKKVLDCQIFYNLHSTKPLNNCSYRLFFEPLINEFIAIANSNDCDINKYPQCFKDELGITDICLRPLVREEPGAMQVPEEMISKITESASEDVLSFIAWLNMRRMEDGEKRISLNIIDRKAEIMAFKLLIDGDDTQHRLILLVGDHGQGKTFLLTLFQKLAGDKKILCIRLDLAQTIGFDAILDCIWRKIGPQHFPSYSARRRISCGVEPKSFYILREELTQAFFEDWKEIPERVPFVLLLDTFERADPVLQQWIQGTLLNKLCELNEVITVVCGRIWPNVDDSLNFHCYRFPLFGVQVKDYQLYISTLGIDMPNEILELVHEKVEGLPKLLAEYVGVVAEEGL